MYIALPARISECIHSLDKCRPELWNFCEYHTIKQKFTKIFKGGMWVVFRPTFGLQIFLKKNALFTKILPLQMLRLLSSKEQGGKDFGKNI